MPQYRVTTPRFHGGTMYGPGTKRDILTVDVPFKKDKDGNLPNGLVLIDSKAEKPTKAEKTSKATAPQPDDATIAAEKSEPENL